MSTPPSDSLEKDLLSPHANAEDALDEGTHQPPAAIILNNNGSQQQLKLSLFHPKSATASASSIAGQPQQENSKLPSLSHSPMKATPVASTVAAATGSQSHAEHSNREPTTQSDIDKSQQEFNQIGEDISEDSNNQNNGNTQNQSCSKDGSKSSGRWTQEEHRKFIEGIKLFQRNWKKVEDYIGTRTGAQIRSHAQKFFNKIEKDKQQQQQQSQTKETAASAPASAPTQASTGTQQQKQASDKKPTSPINSTIKSTTNNTNSNNTSNSHQNNNNNTNNNNNNIAPNTPPNLNSQQQQKYHNSAHSNSQVSSSSNPLLNSLQQQQQQQQQHFYSLQPNPFMAGNLQTIEDLRFSRQGRFNEDPHPFLSNTNVNSNDFISSHNYNSHQTQQQQLQQPVGAQLRMAYEKAMFSPYKNGSNPHNNFGNSNGNNNSNNNSANRFLPAGTSSRLGNFDAFDTHQRNLFNEERDSDEIIIEKYTRMISENTVQENSFFIEHHLADIQEPRLYDMCAVDPNQLNYKSEAYVPNGKRTGGRSRFGSFKLHDEENEVSNQRYQKLRKASIDDQELKKKFKLNDSTATSSPTPPAQPSSSKPTVESPLD